MQIVTEQQDFDIPEMPSWFYWKCNFNKLERR